MQTPKRRRAFENIGVGAAVLGLVAAPMVGTTLSSASAAEPVTVLSVDFEDGTSNGWSQSGGPTLTYPTETVLQVAGRANTWDGITSPTVAVEAGVTYTFSARARLAEGTVGTTSMRFQTGAPSYSWIGNTGGVSAAGWTTVTGTWTPSESKDEAFTFGASELSGSTDPYTYLVDDLLITRPGSEPGTTVTVAAADFETPGRGGWVQSGDPTLTDLAAGKHLKVAGRANNYDGIKSPGVDFEAGVEYTVSARARLAAGTVGTAGLRFVTDPGYQWIGNTTVDASGWTTVSGTWTPTEDTTRALFIGTDDLVGGTGPYTYEVDDIRVTRPAPAGGGTPTVTTVVSESFDGSSLGALQQSGSPTIGYVTEGDGKALSVTDRAETWFTVQSATGVLTAGVEHTFSARVRLLEPDADAIARFTLYDGSFTPVGAAPVGTDGWTTITGTYTVPAGVDASTVKFAIEAGTWAGSKPGFLVDDVLVTRPAGGGSTPVDPVEPGEPETVLASGFESDIEPWQPRGGSAARTTSDARTGDGSMLVSGRTQNWHGAETSINTLMLEGSPYTISAWVKLVPGAAPTTIKMTLDDGASYPEVLAPVDVTDGEWVHLTGTWTRPVGVSGKIYFEAPDLVGFLVDDIEIVGPPFGSVPGDDWEPDLDGFVLGGAVNPRTSPSATARPVAGATSTAALTFDDGPNGAATTELLDFLEDNDVVATFCVIGQNVTAPGGAALLQRIVADGHALCNHGSTYADMGSWTKAQVETDLKANLAIIRDALGDPEAEVPYFRAPNGSWGQTATVAVALGMQPLAVTNTIADWETQDVATLTTNLRASMKNGEIVLVHDGGGDRAGSIAATKTVVAERLAAGWEFTLPAGGADPSWELPTSIDADFEDNTLQGWTGRDNGQGAPTVTVVSPGQGGSQYAARVSDRVSQGQGLQHDVAGIFEAGATYDFSAWIKFEGTPGDVTLSAHVNSGTSSYPNLVSLTGMSNDWVRVSGQFTMPSYTTAAEVYFETRWANGEAGNTSTFLVDNIRFEKRPDPVIQDDLAPLHEYVDVPFGVAIDGRETQRSAAQLLTQHFEQVTAENSMKPENWYDGRTFAPSADTKAVMDFAVANDLRVYGHVLVWHAQTPAWFFQDDAGNPLPVNDASATIVRQRMETHIAKVAEWIADEYGPFGSPTNPVVGWDVVNEVISDNDTSDGMRRSDWYKYLGEEFVDAAFEYADEYVNGVYHAGGSAPRIQLFINDYNSELKSKQDRYYRLVTDLIDRGVPIDGVGHQFHVSLSLPVAFLEGALERFSNLGLLQAVTEFDVTTGTPATEALFIEQGYYYRDAFQAFDRYSDQMFSITVWGLYDTRSWRNANGGPLPFDEGMQAKPAYYGIVGEDLPARMRAANVFAGDVALDEAAFDDVAWQQLPLLDVEGQAAFQAYWAADHLTVYAEVADRWSTLELQVGEHSYRVGRDGSGELDGVVADGSDGWAAVVHLPVTAAKGDTLGFDLRVVDGSDVVGWNTPGHLGELSLVEPLSTVEVVKAASAPAIDGAVDEVWASAATVSTDTQVQGDGGATATVRTMWKGPKLYVLADVVDSTPDTSAAAAHEKDSLEIFLDAGNFKNQTYRYDDLHLRVDADNTVTIGQGDEGFHRARVQSAVVGTATGYRVEVEVDMLDQYVGLGTFHGLDFQVNDAAGGERTSVRTWADPTGLGFQSPQRWGVAHLVNALTPPDEDATPELRLSLGSIKAGGTVTVKLSGFTPGDRVVLAMGDGALSAGAAGGVGAAAVAPAGTTALGSVLVAGNGAATLTVTIPASTPAGVYRIVAAVDGDVLAEGALTVLAADDTTTAPTRPGSTPARGGNLATTGAGLGLGMLGVLVLLTGTVLVVVRRRGHLASEVGRTLRR